MGSAIGRTHDECVQAARVIAVSFLGASNPMVEELVREILALIQDPPDLEPPEFKLTAAPAGKSEIRIPPALETPVFRAAWSEWLEYRRERRKPITPRSMKQQLVDLSKIGSEKAAHCIHESIRNGWTGVFPERYADEQTRSTKGRPGLEAPGAVFRTAEQDSRRRVDGTL